MLGLGVSIASLAVRRSVVSALSQAYTMLQSKGASLWLFGTGGTVSGGKTYLDYVESTASTLAAVDGPVGAVLDSLGVVGPELVVNGADFADTTGWTAGGMSGGAPFGELSSVGGRLRVACGGAGGRVGYASQALATTPGRTYGFTVTGHTATSGSNLRIGSTQEGYNYADKGLTSGVPYSATFLASGSTCYVTLMEVSTVAGQYCDFNNISVREISGIHLTQPTTAAKPTASARVNLLTKTEDFGDAAWTKSGVTITSNTLVSPDGLLTMDALVEDGATSPHTVAQQPTITGSGKLTLFVKPEGRTNCYLLSLGRSPTDAPGGAAYFDLAAGTVSFDPGFSATISSVGSGIYKITMVTTTTLSAQREFRFGASTGGTTQSYAGTSGLVAVHIWGADLRPANSPSNIPAYQRVNTATDYDTVGFPQYLKFDGGDSLSSGAVTLGSNMDCFIVVRRDSAAGVGIVCTTNNSTYFAITATSGSDRADNGAGSPTYCINGVDISPTRVALASALSVGSLMLMEVRNLNLSSWATLSLSMSSNPLIGAIPETILTPALSPAERTQLRQALAAKYGITLS